MCLNYIFDLQTAQYCTAFVVILFPSNSSWRPRDSWPSQPQFNKMHLYCLFDCCRCRIPSTRTFYLLCYSPNIRHISILFIVSTSFHPQRYFAHRNKQSYSCHCWWTGGWQPFTKILGADVRKVEFSTSDGQLHITSSPSFAANRSKLMNTSFSRFLQIQSRAEQTQTHRPRRLRHQCLPSLQKYTRFCAFLA